MQASRYTDAYVGRADAYLAQLSGADMKEMNESELKCFNNIISDYNSAIELSPEEPTLYLKLSEVYGNYGDFDNALLVLEKGIELLDSEELKNEKDRLLRRKNDSEKASVRNADWYLSMQDFVMSNACFKYPGTEFTGEPTLGLHDFNGDGSFELVIQNGDYVMAGSYCYAFGYKDGTPQLIGRVGTRDNNLYYFENSPYPGLFITDGNRGYYQTNYYSYDGNSIHEEEVLADEWNADNVSTGIPITTKFTSDTDLYNFVQSAEFNSTAVLMHRYTKTEIHSMGWDNFAESYLTTDANLANNTSFSKGETVASYPNGLQRFINNFDFSFLNLGYAMDFNSDQPIQGSQTVLDLVFMHGLILGDYGLESESLTTDPLNRFSNGLMIYRVNGEKLDHVLKVVFGCSEDTLELMKEIGNNSDKRYYYKDGYYYYAQFGVGGLSYCEPAFTKYDGDFYYVIFDHFYANDSNPPYYNDQGYAKLSVKDDNGKQYWALYRYNRSPARYPAWIVDDEIYERTLGSITVYTEGLNVRNAPSNDGDIVAVAINDHTYPVYEIIETDKYIWYRIGFDRWIANERGRYWSSYQDKNYIPRHPG